MAYTSVWDETYPPGSELANKIDDIFRQFKLQLQERLESVLIDDMHADPWTLKDNLVNGGGSNQTGLRHNLPMCAFTWDGSSQPLVSYDSGYITGQNDFYVGVTLPKAAKITEVFLWVDKLTNDGIYWQFWKRSTSFLDPDPHAIFSKTYNGTGPGLSDSGAISEVIDASTQYWIIVHKTATGPIRIFGAFIWYEIPAA